VRIVYTAAVRARITTFWRTTFDEKSGIRLMSVPVRNFDGSNWRVNMRSTMSPTATAPPAAFASATVIEIAR